MSKFRAIIEIGRVVAIVFITAILIRVFIFQPFVVEGSSMEPDFHNGEYLLIEKVSYRFQGPKRGDVIVFHYPRNPSVNYIKRIIALPGETVRIENGHILINGQTLDESYLSGSDQTLIDANPELSYEVSLNNKQYFVLGDNRAHSSDSREWGPLDSNFIIGRTALVLYPKSQADLGTTPTN